MGLRTALFCLVVAGSVRVSSSEDDLSAFVCSPDDGCTVCSACCQFTAEAPDSFDQRMQRAASCKSCCETECDSCPDSQPMAKPRIPDYTADHYTDWDAGWKSGMAGGHGSDIVHLLLGTFVWGYFMFLLASLVTQDTWPSLREIRISGVPCADDHDHDAAVKDDAPGMNFNPLFRRRLSSQPVKRSTWEDAATPPGTPQRDGVSVQVDADADHDDSESEVTDSDADADAEQPIQVSMI